MKDRSCAAAALAYARSGLHVFPLQARSKVPLRGSRGHLDATSDPEAVAVAWADDPDRNIGLSPEPSGIFVIDVDPRNGGTESWGRLAKTLNLESVQPAVITGGGGQHYYFQLPSGVRVDSRSSAFGSKYPGIDVKCRGGYVLVPPSMHPHGDVYRFVSDTAAGNPLVAPQSLLNSLKLTQQLDMNVGSGRPKVLEGTRDSFLTSVAGTLWNNGLTAEATQKALLALDQAVCEPPVGDSQVHKIVQSAERSFNRVEVPASAFAAVLVRSVRDILTNPLPSPQYLVNRLLLEDQINLISGVSYAGKSKIAQDMSVSLAAGIPVLGHPQLQVPQKRRVLYLYGEQSPNMWEDRMRSILRLRNVTDIDLPVWLIDAAQLRLSDPAAVEKIISYVQDYSANVVIFDPIGVLSGIDDENDAPTVVRAIRRPIDLIVRATRITPILIHHAGRLSLTQEPFSAQQLVRGSGDFWAMTGSILGVWRNPKTGHVKVLSQGRIESVNPFRVVQSSGEREENPSSTSPLIYGGEWDSTVVVDQHVRLERLVDSKSRITRRDVEEALSLGQSRAGELLAAQVRAGKLRQDGTGRSATYVRA